MVNQGQIQKNSLTDLSTLLKAMIHVNMTLVTLSVVEKNYKIAYFYVFLYFMLIRKQVDIFL